MGMNIKFAEEPAVGQPSPACARIHNLNKAAMQTPGHHKMGQSVWQAGDNNSGQGLCFRQQEMIRGNHDLFSFKAELHSHILHHVN